MITGTLNFKSEHHEAGTQIFFILYLRSRTWLNNKHVNLNQNPAWDKYGPWNQFQEYAPLLPSPFSSSSGGGSLPPLPRDGPASLVRPAKWLELTSLLG